MSKYVVNENVIITARLEEDGRLFAVPGETAVVSAVREGWYEIIKHGTRNILKVTPHQITRINNGEAMSDDENDQDSLAKQAEAIRKMDEATTVIARSYPPMLKSFYDGCLSEGFNPAQAFQLTITLLAKIGSGSSGSS